MDTVQLRKLVLHPRNAIPVFERARNGESDTRQLFFIHLCNRFVHNNVLPHLGSAGMSRECLARALREWFDTLPRQVYFACDSFIDVQLVLSLLGERPANLMTSWLDLRPLIDTSVYHNAVEAFHTPDRPWHHALHDAAAHRSAWLVWMDLNKAAPLGFGSFPN